MRPIRNPQDIADAIFRGAESDRDEIIEKNQKRAEYYQEPLPVPAWDVEQMLRTIDKVTETAFKEPRFQQFAIQNPWNGKSSKKSWGEAAKIILRDSYLVLIAQSDSNLLEQICKIWPEMNPEPTLTKEQIAELAKLQKKADDIVERAKGLVAEFSKLAEQEADIIRGTQSYCDTRISNQTKYVHVNMQYYKEHVKKW